MVGQVLTGADGSVLRVGGEPVTPAVLRGLAAAAEDLSERVADVYDRLRQGDREGARAGFRLVGVGGELRAVAGVLLDTAGDLARAHGTPVGACGLPWGVCPEHGNTLRCTGGVTTCAAGGCGRRWGYDRTTGPCPEPVTHEVVVAGVGHRMCAGHVVAARAELTTPVITPLPDPAS